MGHSKISLFLCRPYHKKMYAHARMKTTLKLVLLYFAYQLLAGAAMAGINLLWPLSATAQLGWALLLSGTAMTAHLVGFGHVNLRQALRPVGADVMLCSLVCIASTVLAGNALSLLIPLPNWLDSDFTALGHTLVGAFSIALLAPWVEELLFRGAILQSLRADSASPWRSILLSALIFGLIHINPAQVPFAILAGIAFGWVSVCTRSLLPAIIGHALNNSLGIVEILAYGNSGAPTPMQEQPTGALLIIALAGTATAIITGRKLTHHILLQKEKSTTK